MVEKREDRENKKGRSTGWIWGLVWCAVAFCLLIMWERR